MKKNTPILGAHVSIAGGFYKAIEEGTLLECTAIQIFTKSSRQWNAKPITQESADTFLTYKKNSQITDVVTHASYLINLGSKNNETQTKSLHALVDEIQRCNTLEIPFLILHPGTINPESAAASLQHIGQSINKALKQTPHYKTSVLIEIMAGQGNSAGRSFEELATIIQQVEDKKRIGICFDTCHAFATGYDFSTKEKFEAMWKHFDTTIGLSYLKVFHLNDSKKEINSNLDRHEHIGKGKIPIQSFKLIMQDERFKNIIKIIETPKEDDDSDAINLKTIKDFCT